MSGNLTKYQLLQHRHLSLLRALQDAGVEAKCDAHGDWTVAIPEKPTMPDGYEFSKQYKSSFSFDEFINVGWTIKTMKEYRIIVPVDEPCSLTCYVNHKERSVSGHIAGADAYRVELTDKLCDLLRCLRGVILAAPAKA